MNGFAGFPEPSLFQHSTSPLPVSAHAYADPADTETGVPGPASPIGAGDELSPPVPPSVPLVPAPKGAVASGEVVDDESSPPVPPSSPVLFWSPLEGVPPSVPLAVVTVHAPTEKAAIASAARLAKVLLIPFESNCRMFIVVSPFFACSCLRKTHLRRRAARASSQALLLINFRSLVECPLRSRPPIPSPARDAVNAPLASHRGPRAVNGASPDTKRSVG